MAKPNDPSPDEALWTANQVAAYLGLSTSWVYREAAAGTLPCCHFVGALRFDPEDIRRFKEASKRAPGRVLQLDKRSKPT